jgi:hypothetical protein
MRRWSVLPSLVGIFGIVCVLGLACGQPAGAGYPLYKPETPRRAAAQVARLRGPVAKVDDRDVRALGPAFELDPGCHVLEADAGGRKVFGIAMTAGYAYLVEVRPGAGDATHPPVTVRETAPDGTTTIWGPMAPENAAAKCRALQEMLMKD